jgi:hypothetical protein
MERLTRLLKDFRFSTVSDAILRDATLPRVSVTSM